MRISSFKEEANMELEDVKKESAVTWTSVEGEGFKATAGFQ